MLDWIWTYDYKSIFEYILSVLQRMTNLFSFTGVHLIGNAYPLNKGFSIFKVIPLATKYSSSSSLVSSLIIHWVAFYIRICYRDNLEVLNRFPSCNIGYISNRNQIWISEVSKALILEYYLLIFSNFARVISDILLKPIKSIIISSFKQ